MPETISSDARSRFIEKPFRRWVIEKASDLVSHVRKAQMDAELEGIVVLAVCLSAKYRDLGWESYARNSILVRKEGEGSFVGPVERIGDTSLWYDDGVPDELVKLICLPSKLPDIPEESKD